MSLIFADSFDHYSSLTNPNGKYDGTGTGASISMGLGESRTGPGCCAIGLAAFGPGKVIRQCKDVLIASSWFSTLYGIVYFLSNEGAAFEQGSCVQLWCNSDRSLSARHGPSYGSGSVIGTSAPGLVQFGTYNALALRTTVSASATIKIWCNGVLVLLLTGVDTRNLHNPTRDYMDAVEGLGPGGGSGICFHDDLYVLDCTDAVNNDYLGPLRIYESVPTADGTVLWTPSVGASNFANVDTIPPDGTLYNSDGSIGDSDQYVHPLNGAVPANSQLFAVQHSMDVEVDSGARSITSDIGGILSPDAVVLSSGYAIDSWPYDQNPVTAAPWLASSFPVLAGPSVTA